MTTTVQARFARVGAARPKGFGSVLGPEWQDFVPAPEVDEDDVSWFTETRPVVSWLPRWEFAVVLDLAEVPADAGMPAAARVWLPRVELKTEDHWPGEKLVIWYRP